MALGHIKARFHEPTQPADETTLVIRLEAKEEKSLSRIRDWSLITGRGGLQNGRGGHVKFYPCEKGGRKKFLPC